MARAKSARTTKPKPENKVLQMPEAVAGNGNSIYSSADLETQIRARAYEIFVQRGFVHGLDREDWYAAEREVLARRSGEKQTA